LPLRMVYRGFCHVRFEAKRLEKTDNFLLGGNN
jgi:hypothetical protein